MIDWKGFQEVAYGPLNLKPNEFWALTYAEFKMMARGYKQRIEDRRQRDAFLLVNLIQPHTKERLSMDTFLGKSSGSSAGSWRSISEEEWEQVQQRKAQGAATKTEIPSWL